MFNQTNALTSKPQIDGEHSNERTFATIDLDGRVCVPQTKAHKYKGHNIGTGNIENIGTIEDKNKRKQNI